MARLNRVIKAVIFDMDDSLYDEMQFVLGGFRAVAVEVSGKGCLSESKIYGRLLEVLSAHGRGRTFDILVHELGLDGELSIDHLVNVYRAHAPQLTLYEDAGYLLKALKSAHYRLGLVTDGDAVVQRKKFSALGLGQYVDCAVFSDDYGVSARKPSAVPYLKVGEGLGVSLSEAIYIGDNPYKDFVTAKKLGMFTVRLLRGAYRDIALERGFEADMSVSDLERILEILP